MADISPYTQQIRQAVYGKDVREALASGIEAISDQQNTYEQNLTNEQSTYQNNLTTQQNNFQTSITNQQNNYEAELSGRQDDYEEALTAQQNAFETNINAAEDIRVSNEDVRKADEITRQANEVTRQDVYNDFRNFVNSAEQIGRVPYLFDGGDYGDTNTEGLILDGGDY